jgi:pimeloyl-ACP methyl ester carboxylesterase
MVATVLVPGLLNTARLYAEQVPGLWLLGPVLIADHRHDDSLAAVARRLLVAAPPRFALVGLSMGGYVAFEVLRQAPERVGALVLIDTSARPDLPEQSERREALIEQAEGGGFADVAAGHAQQFVAMRRRTDVPLLTLMATMASETGVDAYVRQQRAILGRMDSRPMLGAIRCPALVLVGEEDALTPPDLAREIAAGIPGAKLDIIPGSGHLAPIEAPEAVTRALVSFVQAVDEG